MRVFMGISRVRWLEGHFRYIAVGLLLTSCTVDRTNDPRVSKLVNKCFATVEEAIFYSGWCKPIGTLGYSYCDRVESLNPHPHSGGAAADPFPPTLKAYRVDPNYWSARIHEADKGTVGLRYCRIDW